MHLRHDIPTTCNIPIHLLHITVDPLSLSCSLSSLEFFFLMHSDTRIPDIPNPLHAHTFRFVGIFGLLVRFRFPEPPLILLYQYCVLLPLLLSLSLSSSLYTQHFRVFGSLCIALSFSNLSFEIECIHTRAALH